jgi:hypothetical protein
VQADQRAQFQQPMQRWAQHGRRHESGLAACPGAFDVLRLLGRRQAQVGQKTLVCCAM